MKLLSKKFILPTAVVSGIVATGVGVSMLGSSPVLPESSQKKWINCLQLNESRH